jgi:osmoprotectant transport system ATP-binding protein
MIEYKDKIQEEEINALEFINTCKRFTGMKKNAVNQVNLTIKNGEFITILGTSGSGKTTLMKMVNRLHDITEGDILFYGKSIRDLNGVEHRRKIGYVVQQGGLFPHMTVERNISVVPRILKWDQNRISERVNQLLELVDLKPEIYRRRYPRQLSGGQQQRVGIARAMAADPAIMLMDEPFGAIDAITRGSLQDELISFQKKMKKTILFVTHDIHEAFKLGDKVIVMDEGRLQQFDTPNNIMLHPANEFVKKLVSADDVLERLKMMTISGVMVPICEKNPKMDIVLHKKISIEESLPIFMKDKNAVIYVKDDSDILVGKLSWNQLSSIIE